MADSLTLLMVVSVLLEGGGWQVGGRGLPAHHGGEEYVVRGECHLLRAFLWLRVFRYR